MELADTNGLMRIFDAGQSRNAPQSFDIRGCVRILSMILPNTVPYKNPVIPFIQNLRYFARDRRISMMTNSSAPMAHRIITPFTPGFLTSIFDTNRYPTSSITP